jgi:CheY-like chemotaxis protein
MKTVLFVDDDPYWSQNYQEQLRKHFNLIYKSSADGAMAQLLGDDVIDLLVVDVMMDTPDSVDLTETEGGLMTGVYILEKTKTLLIQEKIPAIMLTNRQKKVVLDAVNALGYPAGQISVFSKAEMSAKQLASEAQRRLGK